MGVWTPNIHCNVSAAGKYLDPADFNQLAQLDCEAVTALLADNPHESCRETVMDFTSSLDYSSLLLRTTSPCVIWGTKKRNILGRSLHEYFSN